MWVVYLEVFVLIYVGFAGLLIFRGLTDFCIHAWDLAAFCICRLSGFT